MIYLPHGFGQRGRHRRVAALGHDFAHHRKPIAASRIGETKLANVAFDSEQKAFFADKCRKHANHAGAFGVRNRVKQRTNLRLLSQHERSEEKENEYEQTSKRLTDDLSQHERSADKENEKDMNMKSKRLTDNYHNMRDQKRKKTKRRNEKKSKLTDNYRNMRDQKTKKTKRRKEKQGRLTGCRTGASMACVEVKASVSSA